MRVPIWPLCTGLLLAFLVNNRLRTVTRDGGKDFASLPVSDAGRAFGPDAQRARRRGIRIPRRGRENRYSNIQLPAARGTGCRRPLLYRRAPRLAEISPADRQLRLHRRFRGCRRAYCPEDPKGYREVSRGNLDLIERPAAPVEGQFEFLKWVGNRHWRRPAASARLPPGPSSTVDRAPLDGHSYGRSSSSSQRSLRLRHLQLLPAGTGWTTYRKLTARS